MLATITIPRLKIRWSRYTVDPSDVFFGCMAIGIGLAIIVGTIIGLVSWQQHQSKWVNTPPPKVVTKVVKENGLTTAQNEYIRACRESGDTDPNVPDVHGDKWTCINVNR